MLLQKKKSQNLQLQEDSHDIISNLSTEHELDFYKQKRDGQGERQRHLSQKLDKGKASSCL